MGNRRETPFANERMLCLLFLSLPVVISLRPVAKTHQGEMESSYMWTHAYKHTLLKGHIKEGRFIVVSFQSVNMAGSYKPVP